MRTFAAACGALAFLSFGASLSGCASASEQGAGVVSDVAFAQFVVLEAAEKRLGDAQSVVEARLAQAGVSDFRVSLQGEHSARIELPADVTVDGAFLGALTRNARLSVYLVDEQTDPFGYPLGVETRGKLALPMRDGGEPLVLGAEPAIAGLSVAEATFEASLRQNAISVTLDEVGAESFGVLTTQQVGKRVALVLNGEILTAPFIRTPLLGGEFVVTGGFSVAQSEALVAALTEDELPVALVVTEVGTIER